MRIVLVLTMLLTGTAAAAQPPAPAADATGEAYYEFLLARRLEAQGDTAGALQALERALALDPKSAELHAELAGFHARQNNGPEAVAAAERALEFDPNNAEAHRMLGLVYAAWSESGAPDGRSPAELREAAIEHLTAILETPAMATDLNLQMALARLLMRNDNPARAVPILEHIVSQAPFASEPYTMLSDAHLSLGAIDAAIEAMEMAAELNPRNYLRLGDLYERQKRWEDAAAAYEQALSSVRGPASRELRLRYAAALLNVPGDQSAARARDVLKDFLVTAPQDARGLFLLSNANLRLRDFKGAEQVARKLLALDPGSIPALHAVAAALLSQREYREVIALLAPVAKSVETRSDQLRGDTSILMAQLAHAHTGLGEHGRAIAILTAAVERHPDSATALNSLGYTLADRGERLPEAIEYIERALAVDPDNPSYIDSLGWALFKQGRYEEAEPHLRRAAEALPTNSVVQDHYGDVLAQRQKYQEAIAAWQRALDGDGQDVDRAAIEKKIKDARARQQQ